MARKKKQEVEEQGESAPLWIISFADLVTLMLSFFVILSATNSGSGSGSGSEKNPAMERVAIAIRAAFSELNADETAILAANTRF
jgi:flagellar motor protein MotB